MNHRKTIPFKDNIRKELSFLPEEHKEFTLYRNKERPELGYSLHYERKGYYSLGIGDYTIPHDFILPFSHDLTFMKFGMFYMGKTQYQLKGQPISYSTPSSFFVIESNLEGVQKWQRGQRYYGAEISIYMPYFKEVILPLYPEADIMNRFEINNTYHYLPEEIVRIIEQIVALAEKNTLTGIYLESKIMECIAILTNTLNSSINNAFTFQTHYGSTLVGNRQIKLIPSDIKSIQEAHQILTKEFNNPPSIAQLSHRIFLNEQKLKAGFTHYYHISIGDFVTSVRMTKAANLLATTDLNVETVSRQVGYEYSGNFSRMFKKTYGKSPFAFRKAKAH
jgi:AraC-like DNA-binding protein